MLVSPAALSSSRAFVRKKSEQGQSRKTENGPFVVQAHRPAWWSPASGGELCPLTWTVGFRQRSSADRGGVVTKSISP